MSTRTTAQIPIRPARPTSDPPDFLPHVDLFDGPFFGVSPREMRSMDPQQRLLLEVAWESFENAGQGRGSLFGKQVGVFIGIGNNEYARLMNESASAESIDLYSTVGNVLSAASGRVSYTLGLQGPSVSLDTACSSSLVAVHLACQSLRTGESAMAIAGGVNLILSPDTMIAMSRVPGGLSLDARCKAFDAAADGLGRGEGCGLVVLKRLSDAGRDRDNIVAVIRGSAVNQDGRSAALTVPNGKAQASLIEQALSNAKVSPDQVSYIETHGPGTALGDPIEAAALGAVFGQSGARSHPLILGSVKTNFGHLETAAGVAGLIKTALMLRHGEIPANLHFKTPNPHIAWDRLQLTVPTERISFPSNGRGRIVGVSSFGISGTNAHAILEGAPVERGRERGCPGAKPDALLLPLSAKSEQALRDLTKRYQRHLKRHPHLDPADVCFTASVGRFHFPHRLAVVSLTIEGLREQLGGLDATSSRFVGEGSVSPLRIGLAFPDAIATSEGVGNLYRTSRVFREAIDECDRLLERRTRWSLRAAVAPGANNSSASLPPEYASAISLALACALARLWCSWGIVPSAAAGSGFGEVMAACVGGALSLDDALTLSLENCPQHAVTRDDLSRIAASKPKIHVVSWSTGRRLTEEEATVDYWLTAMKAKPSGAAPFADETVDVILDTASGFSPDGGAAMLARLYVLGAAIDWDGYYADAPCGRLPLPTYPFQRQRYWFEKGERRKEPEPVADQLGEHLYDVKWRPQSARAPQAPAAGGTWLILADRSGTAAELAAHLAVEGSSCVLVHAGERYEEVSATHVRLDPGNPEHFGHLVDRLAQQSSLRGVVHLWGVDCDDRELPLQELKNAIKVECASLLHLMQAVVKARFESSPKVWLVTRGAVQVDDREALSVAQAPAWAVMAVVEHEHPELGCARIDLDPAGSAMDVAQLASEIGLAADEKQVAFRGSRRFVARLARCGVSAENDRAPLALRPDGPYLVTGGLGGLGRILAGWLVEKGARHLVLLGRSLPTAEVQAQLQELVRRGAEVTVAAADVSDAAALESALAPVGGAKALRGVFHCAGALDDGVCVNQTWDRFEAVLRPKVDGAWNLHALTRNANLDFFVLFSSASALLGNPGQSNYASANAFLDGLARLRRARGMPALSINWGIWSDDGHVADRRLEPLLNTAGVGSLSTQDGLASLERVLRGAAPQVAVIPIQWPAFLKRIGDWRFVDELRNAAGDDGNTAPPFVAILQKAPAHARRTMLFDHIRSQIEEVLGMRTPGAFDAKLGFFEMGMDSLTSLELSRRIQSSLSCRLPSTVAFECPTIDALVDYLAKNNLAALFAPEREALALSPGSPDDDMDARLARMSDDEVGRLVDERLEFDRRALEPVEVNLCMDLGTPPRNSGCGEP